MLLITIHLYIFLRADATAEGPVINSAPVQKKEEKERETKRKILAKTNTKKKIKQ